MNTTNGKQTLQALEEGKVVGRASGRAEFLHRDLLDHAQASADVTSDIIRALPLLSAEGIATIARTVERALEAYYIANKEKVNA